MAIRPFVSENYFKNEASKLFKHLHSDNPVKQKFAEQRFSILTRYALTPDTIQRKHALTVVAIEAGFGSWSKLKKQINKSPINYRDFFGAPQFGGTLNHWFKTYSAAKEYLRAKGGYLLPFRDQYFVATPDFIQNIGLDQQDPDWQRIGYDWIHPECPKALNRLKQKLESAYQPGA
ncbi:hypothetical protein [Teredinibacter sp. KSP-S5-2]|uniref:hypothetical protein n=1 Tax=Teredinibacter sp. KSP-S5-2 TaxID=3034506 RepID=UPI0029349062|nr:hypothetical protein [Teredinibacter sp. KSP-S5-2]WNO10263.1 hypothetical protein P5V12_03655 [Teredinibacter sp. KSP-S5-2]